ncbi:MAG: hypothetical protein AAGC44_08925 [Planctomycetota bacterium]
MDDERLESLHHIAHHLWPKREPRVQYAGRPIAPLDLGSAIRNKPMSWARDRRNPPRALADLPTPGRPQLGRRLCCIGVV